MAKKAKKPTSHFGPTMVTQPGRLDFPVLARPEAYQDKGGKRYGALLICKKTDKLAELIKEIRAIGLKAFGEDYTTNALYYKPYQSGEAVIKKIAASKEDKICPDSYVQLYTDKVRLTAHGSEDKDPPRLYLADKSILPRRPGNEEDLQRIEQTFYRGCVARLLVTPFSYKKSDVQCGVGLILKGVQFVADAEKIGGADLDGLVSESFGDEDDWADEADEAKGFEDSLEDEDEEEANL